MHELAARRLKDEALARGASRAGICRAEPVAHGDVLLAWLAAGRHGDMAYMARNPERRLDPRHVMPEARSCVVIAVDPGTDPPPGVARYAQGEDYHDVLGRILGAVRRVVEEELSGVGRAFVDTGPLLERELAMAAGLGFIGKNTNLIHQRAGSYALLGVLLTDLDLPADAPSVPRCGTCTRCLDLCPTDAFVAPYVLDGRRCISDLTIETRGDIPRPLREQTGAWVHGCDVCQDVCPWNRKARPAPHGALEGGPPLSPVETLAMDDAAFRAAYRRSALWRPRPRGARRNALAALGHRPGDASPGRVRAALRDPDAMVRRHAAWALSRGVEWWRRRRRGTPRDPPRDVGSPPVRDPGAPVWGDNGDA
jgi:epoxyqueuosine reductase